MPGYWRVARKPATHPAPTVPAGGRKGGAGGAVEHAYVLAHLQDFPNGGMAPPGLPRVTRRGPVHPGLPAELIRPGCVAVRIRRAARAGPEGAPPGLVRAGERC